HDHPARGVIRIETRVRRRFTRHVIAPRDDARGQACVLRKYAFARRWWLLETNLRLRDDLAVGEGHLHRGAVSVLPSVGDRTRRRGWAAGDLGSRCSRYASDGSVAEPFGDVAELRQGHGTAAMFGA